jgi:hypothetical protein
MRHLTTISRVPSHAQIDIDAPKSVIVSVIADMLALLAPLLESKEAEEGL